MREHIRFYATICTAHLALLDPIVEFGSRQVVGQEGYADMRPIFKRSRYIGTDIQGGLGVDVVTDMSQAGLQTGSVGTVVSFDALEHTEYVREAVAEVHRVLKPNGGLFIVSTVMDFIMHELPHDYWRFTPYGLQNLLRVFEGSAVFAAGEPSKPHTVVGIGMKGETKSNIGKFVEAMSDWVLRVEH